MKRIIFCADGTWNGTGVDEDHDGVPDVTNVLKLFHLLEGDTTLDSRRLQDEIEKARVDADGTPVQIAKYLHGVGDSRNPIMKLLGGTFGSGIIARIVRGYTYVSRNYQPGDAIYTVGFSRGAYTARALAGMISAVGLLDASKLDLGDKERAYAWGVAAWRKYRQVQEDKQKDAGNLTLAKKLAGLIASLPWYARMDLAPDHLLAAPVKCVAVWDTVGALGIPDVGTDPQDTDAFRFADSELSRNVEYGIHAVSLDERRNNFKPTLWTKGENLTQMWFAGAHADVGGGYPASESDLANISLAWMMEVLAEPALGLAFKPFPSDWRLQADAPSHQPWAELPWTCFGSSPRTWGGLRVTEHPSVVQRRNLLGNGPPRMYAAKAVPAGTRSSETVAA